MQKSADRVSLCGRDQMYCGMRLSSPICRIESIVSCRIKKITNAPPRE
jgi:hypothetical protein